MSQQIGPYQVSRDSVEVEEIGAVRFYEIIGVAEDGPDVDRSVIGAKQASVTSITDTRWTPEKDDAIEGWKNYRDGPRGTGHHWKDIRNFKGNRGTLAHYVCLNPLADGDLRGEEEDDAEAWLADFGDYRGVDAKKKALRDVSWVSEQFSSLREPLGIDDGTVHDVEQYVWHTDPPYAGQFDLLYETPDGTVTLADIKTSKLKLPSDASDDPFAADELGEDALGRLDGYGLQLAAYRRACEYDVDECQVIWLSPDTKNVRVVCGSDFPRNIDSYEREFAGLAERTSQSLLTEYNA